MTHDPATPRPWLDPLPPAQVERLRNAIISPVTDRRGLASGVFRADGSFCETSRCFMPGRRFTDIPDAPATPGLTRLEGRHLFAGLGRGHFGHFLLESMTRLWALSDLHPEVDSLVFTPLWDAYFDKKLKGIYLPLIRVLGLGKPCTLVTRPVCVDHLLLPSQGIGHRHWIAGTPEFRRFIHDRLGSDFPADGPEKIYISRRRLRGADKPIDQEARIERIMQRSGYTVFHPQEHPIDVQLSRYKAARRIVGGDGSAFHLAAFVLQPGTQVALIQRRDGEALVQSFVDQITAFSTASVTRINVVIPKKLRPDPMAQPTPINLPRLRRKLGRAGFI